MLRITLAQLNLTVGDIEGNVTRMIATAQQAAAAQADIVVFSELSLCAYYPGDMLDEAAFQSRITAGLAALREEFNLPDVSNAADAALAADVAQWAE